MLSFGRQVLDLLLSTDPRRRILVGMALLSLLLMVCSAVVILYLESAGVIKSDGIARWWAVASVGGLLVMTGLIRSGWTARLKDPSLTIAQMGWTITSGAVGYVFAGEARGVVPSVLAMILFFGALGLNLGQVLGIGLFAIGAFAVAILVSSRGAFHEPMDIGYALMVMIVLLGCMALNLRIQRIRQHLHDKRKALAEALHLNREMALRDELTDLRNRRAMVELLELEQKRQRRKHGKLVLAMLDLDHFKPINDQRGHAVGDQALKAFVATALCNLREVDVLARWGGDEFILLLTDTSLQVAAALLERIRKAVAGLQIDEVDGPLGLTLSAGLAMNRPGESLEETLNRADLELYRAKAQGRNRIAWQIDHGEDPNASEKAAVARRSIPTARI